MYKIIILIIVNINNRLIIRYLSVLRVQLFFKLKN